MKKKYWALVDVQTYTNLEFEAENDEEAKHIAIEEARNLIENLHGFIMLHEDREDDNAVYCDKHIDIQMGALK